MSRLVTPGTRNALRRRLATWYRRIARDLPWRRTRDPYAIWISEIMLQQTQVDTVIPYYRRFLGALPDVAALAQAPEDQVLKLWEGLGYYRRARMLQKAAKMIVAERRGVLPSSAREWQTLPGIGAYTAGAIASIALGEPAPIVDGNVKRILARIFMVEGNLDRGAGLERIWALAGELVPQEKPGEFNQAMMELGALLCKPEQPQCPGCPVQMVCQAFASGMPAAWPERSAAAPRPHKVVVVGVLLEKGRVLIGKRPAGGLLGGLWEFPGGTVESGESLSEALVREFSEETGVEISVGDRIIVVKHAYTHFSITLHAFHVRRENGTPQAQYHQTLRWAKMANLGTYAFPVANQKILKKLGIPEK